jgi:hypothetical protein
MTFLKVRSEPYNAIVSQVAHDSPRWVLPKKRLSTVSATVAKEYGIGMRWILLTLDSEASHALCGKSDLPSSAWVRSI